MTRTDFPARVRRGDPMIGMINFSASPLLVELAGLAGYDFVFIDTEHTPASWTTVDSMIVAARASDTAAVVRVATISEEDILLALDSGADAIVVSHISTAEQAEEVVRCAKYPPRGRRGMGGPHRATAYGIPPWQDYAKRANEHSVVIVIVEDLQGVENIDEICAVDGVDVVFLGAGDLTQEMGLDFVGMENERVAGAMTTVRDTCKKHSVGLMVTAADDPNPENVKRLWEFGGTMVLNNVDTNLIAGEFRRQVSGARGTSD
jgi:2-keto-3-deoxy-L-rhamnonate aldolase RhmA